MADSTQIARRGDRIAAEDFVFGTAAIRLRKRLGAVVVDMLEAGAKR